MRVHVCVISTQMLQVQAMRPLYPHPQLRLCLRSPNKLSLTQQSLSALQCGRSVRMNTLQLANDHTLFPRVNRGGPGTGAGRDS